MSCEVFCALSPVLNMKYLRGIFTLHSWQWLLSSRAVPELISSSASLAKASVAGEFSRGFLTLGELHWAPEQLGKLSGSWGKHLWLWCKHPPSSNDQLCLWGVTIALSYTFHPPLFLPVSSLLTAVTDRRIKRWIFSWAVLQLAWHDGETRISESVFHSFLPQIGQIQWFGLLHLLHRSVCISEVSVMLLDVIVS